MWFWPKFSPRLQQRHRNRSLRFETLEARMMLAADILGKLDDLSHDQHTHESGGGHAAGCCCGQCAGLAIESSGNWFDGYLDPYGNRYFEEPLLEIEESVGEGAAGGAQAVPFPLDQTFSLHSNPGANHTIYLDFDGHVTSGTYWNSSFNGGEDIVTPAYSFEGDSSSFTDNELERIQRIWRWVSEDFVPFDVNVTTEDPGTGALSKTSGSDSSWGVRIVIGPNTFYSNAGGVAYLNSFNWSTDTPAFVFNTSELGIAEAASHEAGHTLGLRHDGQEPGDGAYYFGHGSGETGWAPIMGVGYYENLTQWSRGEYANANNSEDDLQVITSYNGFGYRSDDHGDSIATATPLFSGSGTISGEGIIERNSDDDVFSFTANGGQLEIEVDPFDFHPNLDILAELYSSSGSLVASSNPSGALDAEITATVGAGTYYLRITGVGQGDPLGTGYTDYGSLGYYSISGTGAGGADSLAPGASLNAADIITPVGASHTFTVTYNDNVAVDVSDLDHNDLVVSGPGGYSAGASFVSVNDYSDGTPRVAAYQIAAPGGDWDGDDNGAYTISMLAGEVSDTSGNFVAAGALGSFTVNIPVADRFEANNSFAEAADLGSGDRTEAGLNIHSSSDGDFFKWVAPDGGTLNVDVLFQHSDGDLDLLVYGPDMVALENSLSVTDNESVTIPVAAGETYYVNVYGYNGATNPNYDLLLDGPEATLQTIGETGSVTINHSWTTVELENNYVDPVVIAQPPSYNGSHQSTIRLQNVTANSFEIQVDEWNYHDGWHTTETVGYLVVEAGAHTLEDGTMLFAGKESVNHSWSTIDLGGSFATTPVVFSQSQTNNGWQAIVTRQQNVTTSSLDVRLQEEEGNDGWHARETVGILAVEAGSGSWYEAGVTGNEVDHSWHALSFDQTHASPILLAGMQTAHGIDPSSLRYRSLTDSGVDIRVEEEQSADSETWHKTEVVGYLAFNAPGPLLAVAAASPQPAASNTTGKVPANSGGWLPRAAALDFLLASESVLSSTPRESRTAGFVPGIDSEPKVLRDEGLTPATSPTSLDALNHLLHELGEQHDKSDYSDAASDDDWMRISDDDPFAAQIDALFSALGQLESAIGPS